MVDPVGIKGGPVVDRRLAPVGPAARAQAPAASANDDLQRTTSAQGMVRSLAAEAPVDAERVARIRRAIEEGRFPLVPSTVADRLLALKLQWDPNGQA